MKPVICTHALTKLLLQLYTLYSLERLERDRERKREREKVREREREREPFSIHFISYTHFSHPDIMMCVQPRIQRYEFLSVRRRTVDWLTTLQQTPPLASFVVFARIFVQSIQISTAASFSITDGSREWRPSVYHQNQCHGPVYPTIYFVPLTQMKTLAYGKALTQPYRARELEQQAQE